MATDRIFQIIAELADDKYHVISGALTCHVLAENEFEARRAVFDPELAGHIPRGYHITGIHFNWIRTPEEFEEDPLTCGYFRKRLGTPVLDFVSPEPPF